VEPVRVATCDRNEKNVCERCAALQWFQTILLLLEISQDSALNVPFSSLADSYRTNGLRPFLVGLLTNLLTELHSLKQRELEPIAFRYNTRVALFSNSYVRLDDKMRRRQGICEESARYLRVSANDLCRRIRQVPSLEIVNDKPISACHKFPLTRNSLRFSSAHYR
jgi:hypothetical protein